MQNGSAASEPRSRCASLHHGRVSAPTEYKDVARAFVHHTRAPLGLRHPTTASVPSCLEPSRIEPYRWALTRPTLDRSCARRLPRSVWVGARKWLPGRTRKLRVYAKCGEAPPLTKNSPYKVFRCRPITAVRHPLGPALKRVQGKNPQELIDARPRVLWGLYPSSPVPLREVSLFGPRKGACWRSRPPDIRCRAP